MTDFIDAGWARRAVERIEQAVAAWNEKFPSTMRIVWGYANAEEAAEAEAESRYGPQEGLLHWCDRDYQVEVYKSGDPMTTPDHCHISLDFIDEAELPLTPRDLFNVLKDCQETVQLSVMPSGDGIAVVGVCTMLPVPAIGRRTLADALSRLGMSRDLVGDRLLRNEGDDHWSTWGGEDSD